MSEQELRRQPTPKLGNYVLRQIFPILKGIVAFWNVSQSPMKKASSFLYKSLLTVGRQICNTPTVFSSTEYINLFLSWDDFKTSSLSCAFLLRSSSYYPSRNMAPRVGNNSLTHPEHRSCDLSPTNVWDAKEPRVYNMECAYDLLKFLHVSEAGPSSSCLSYVLTM